MPRHGVGWSGVGARESWTILPGAEATKKDYYYAQNPNFKSTVVYFFRSIYIIID
jgi:hypothetical protein